MSGLEDRVFVPFNLGRGVRSNLDRLKAEIAAADDAELLRRALALFQRLTDQQQGDHCTFQIRVGSGAYYPFSLYPEILDGTAGDSPPEQVRFDLSQEAFHALNKLKQVHQFGKRVEVVRAALNVLERLIVARRAEKIFVVIAPESEPTTVPWDELIR